MIIDVERIAELARLRLDGPELERMAGELAKIVAYIDQLAEVDTAGISDLPSIAPTPLRADEVGPSIPREKVAANAPSFSEGFFVVPQVIGNE